MMVARAQFTGIVWPIKTTSQKAVGSIAIKAGLPRQSKSARAAILLDKGAKWPVTSPVEPEESVTESS